MSGKRTRTPEEIWASLEKEAKDDAAERVAAERTPQEVAARLAAAGFDVEAEKAEAAGFREEMARSAAARRARIADAQRRSQPRRRRPMVVWLVAAALGVAAGGGLIYALTRPGVPLPAPPGPSAPPPPSSSPGSESAPLIAPEELRRQAFRACAESRWDACLDLFDRAAKQDPAGDRAPEVQAARRGAEKGMTEPPLGNKWNDR
jgi:hypothetical protein